MVQCRGSGNMSKGWWWFIIKSTSISLIFFLFTYYPRGFKSIRIFFFSPEHPWEHHSTIYYRKVFSLFSNFSSWFQLCRTIGKLVTNPISIFYFIIFLIHKNPIFPLMPLFSVYFPASSCSIHQEEGNFSTISLLYKKKKIRKL